MIGYLWVYVGFFVKVFAIKVSVLLFVAVEIFCCLLFVSISVLLWVFGFFPTSLEMHGVTNMNCRVGNTDHLRHFVTVESLSP